MGVSHSVISFHSEDLLCASQCCYSRVLLSFYREQTWGWEEQGQINHTGKATVLWTQGYRVGGLGQTTREKKQGTLVRRPYLN